MYKKYLLTMMIACVSLPCYAGNVSGSRVKLPAAQAAVKENPLLTESTLPLHYPRFDLIKNADYAPAFEQGMNEQLKEMDAIARNKALPTFENTIVAMEKSGELLTRVSNIFFNLNSANTNPDMQQLES